MRILEIQETDGRGRRVAFVGEEIEALCQAWQAEKARPSWWGVPSRFAAPPKLSPAEHKAKLAAVKAARKAGAAFDWDDPPAVVLWDWLEPSLRLPQALHDAQEAAA